MPEITEIIKNLIEFLNTNLNMEEKKNETIKEFNNLIKDCLEKYLSDIKQQQDEFLFFLDSINAEPNMLDLLDSPNLELIEKKIKELPKPLTLETTELQEKINLRQEQLSTKKPVITVKTDPSVDIEHISFFAKQYGYTIQQPSVPPGKSEKYFYTITKQLAQSSQEEQSSQTVEPAHSPQSIVDLATFNVQGVMTIPIKTDNPPETYREQLKFLTDYIEN
ncbi:MAG: hypothetical protein ACR2HS_04540, partial [Gammaproteobacteria bacterium]